MKRCLEIVGVTFGVIGFIAAVVTCALPMWRLTAISGANIVAAQVIGEGLWKICVTQSTGQMQCKIYDSMLPPSRDLQAARAMMVISIILGILGVMISIVGAKCTNCIEDKGAKAKMMIISAIFFILAGVLVLIPVCWFTHTIQDFYNPLLIEAQKREIGALLYIGWISAALFLIGGVMLCCSLRYKENNPPRVAYSAPHSTG